MWTRAVSVLLFLLGGNANAAENNPSALASLCYWTALVDLACSKLPEHLAQRSSCTEARAAQRKCLEQALPKASAGPSGPSSSGAAPLALPAVITPPKSSPDRPVGPGPANSPKGSADGARAYETETRPKISPEANPVDVDRVAVVDEPIAAIRAARGGGEIVSERRTPLDDTLLVFGVIHSISNVKDSPNTFEVRCRAQRTELALSTDGVWVAPSDNNNIQVDYRINNGATVRQPWILSADGKTATYNDDPVKLLRSMPNRATLKVTIADSANVSHEATFRLTRLAMIKRKIAAACGWDARNRRAHARP